MWKRNSGIGGIAALGAAELSEVDGPLGLLGDLVRWRGSLKLSKR